MADHDNRQLDYETMPAASPASLAALTSEISTERTAVTIDIKFKTQGRPAAADAAVDPHIRNSSSAHSDVSTVDGAADVPTAGLVGWWHASDVRLFVFLAHAVSWFPP